MSGWEVDKAHLLIGVDQHWGYSLQGMPGRLFARFIAVKAANDLIGVAKEQIEVLGGDGGT